MKKSILSLLMTMVLLFTVTGCTSNDVNSSSDVNSTSTSSEVTSTSSETPSSSEETAPVALPTEDRSGNAITIPEKIESVVVLAPSITEVLVDIGIKEKIVAVDTQTSTRLEGFADFTAFDMMQPDAEKIADLNPSIVFVSGMSLADGEDPFKPLKDLGICVVYIPTSNSIEDIKKDINFISAVFGKTEEGKKLIETMETEIANVAKIGETIKEEEKKTVFFEISAAPYIYSFGKGVFLNEMIEILGAKNAMADSESWIPVEAETALNANPDVILTNVDYIEDSVAEIKARSGWENVNAVKNNEVFFIDNMSSSLSNHNIVKALKEMAKAIYPDKY